MVRQWALCSRLLPLLPSSRRKTTKMNKKEKPYFRLYTIRSLRLVYSLVMGIVVLVGALVAATIYYYTENIIYVIIEHIAHNILCLFDFNKVDLFGSSVYSRRNGFVIMNTGYMIINMILLAGCLVWFFKYFKPKYSMKA